MTNTLNKDELAKAVQKVLTRAAVDEVFRKLCLTNPAEAVKQETGKTLPAGYKLRFVDGSGADATIVLPALMLSAGEMNDQELDAVSGGAVCGLSGAGTCSLTGSTTGDFRTHLSSL